MLAGQIVVLQSQFGGFGPAEVGLLGGIALVVTAVFQFLFGIMSDRRDPSRFLPIGIAILGLGSLLVALASSFWTLLAFVALSRIGASFYHPVGISWIGREFEGAALDHSMGFQSAFGDSGVILGMASGAVLAVAFGWQSPFVLWGGVNLLAVAMGLALARGRSSPPPPGQALARNYLEVLRDVRLWLLPLAVGGAVFNIFSFFGPLLLYGKFGVPKDLAGVAVALWILAGSVAAFFFGRVSRRFGRYRALVTSYAALTVAGLVGALVDNLWVVLVLFWSLGSALFLTYPALFSFVAESSHRQLQGAAFGLIFAFSSSEGRSACSSRVSWPRRSEARSPSKPPSRSPWPPRSRSSGLSCSSWCVGRRGSIAEACDPRSHRCEPYRGRTIRWTASRFSRCVSKYVRTGASSWFRPDATPAFRSFGWSSPLAYALTRSAWDEYTTSPPNFGSRGTMSRPRRGSRMSRAISRTGFPSVSFAGQNAFPILRSISSGASFNRILASGFDFDIFPPTRSMRPPPSRPGRRGVCIATTCFHPSFGARSRYNMWACRWSMPPRARSSFIQWMSATCIAG